MSWKRDSILKPLITVYRLDWADGDYYFGMTSKGIQVRLREHAGKRSNPTGLKISEHGWPSVVILHTTRCKPEARRMEQGHIASAGSDPACLNRADRDISQGVGG